MSAETQKKRIADFLGTEWNKLVGYVRSWIEDSGDRDAEDIVQDVIAGVFERADVMGPIEDLAAYFYRSLRNRIVDAYRRGSKKTVALTEPVLDERYEASMQAEWKENREKLFEAIDSLVPAQKSVLVATELEGRSFRELSEEWDVPIGTLLARKHRAIHALRKALEGGTA
ncbi:MAG TPA: sigma-70 family RNA polymerase sigma factor [Spirochaetia bacterium]|nr:sigma-70 family RNA polymerase sigma factor [Spirochaetia bacterium]